MMIVQPIMIVLDQQIKKRGNILVLTEGRKVRKHFAVLDKITRQLIFYDIISIAWTHTRFNVP